MEMAQRKPKISFASLSANGQADHSSHCGGAHLLGAEDKPAAPGTYIPKDRGLRVDFSKGDWWRCRHDFERTAFGYNPPKYGLPRQRAVQGYSQLKPMPQTVKTGE